MASSTTGSIDVQPEEWQRHSNRVPHPRVIPKCYHTESTALQRLATFSDIDDHSIIAKISSTRLAGSGCVYNSEEEYIECTYGGKITKINDSPTMKTLYDLKHYHHPLCGALTAYISKQEREISQGIAINLRILKRSRSQRIGGTHGFDSLIHVYGITPRGGDFDVVLDYM
ncbi:uncharacterized protein LOC134268210 [Saccostrea cucullata]|uniref:uncharacterized protein LOC134268210 n=1 Tax=Saccostrea cuccullata TaxID=36930 RepID=UPI002ED606C2